jgi:PAS domain S-box-containing protein
MSPELSLRENYLKKWIFLTIAVLILITVLILSYNIFKESESQITREFDEHQLYIANDLKKEINNSLNSVDENAEYLSLTGKDFDVKELIKRDRILRSFYKSYVESISFYNSTGKLIYSNSNETSQLAKEDIDNTFNSNNNFYIDDEMPTGKSGAISNFIIYIPLKDMNILKHKVPGSLIAAFRINAPEFFKSKVSGQNFKEKFGLWVIDKEGNVLFQSDHPGMQTFNTHKMANNCLNCHIETSYITQITNNETGHIEYSLKNFGEKNASFTTLNLNNEKWKIVVTTPSDEVTKYLVNAARQAGILLMLVIISFSIIAYFIIKISRTNTRAKEELEFLTEKNKLLNQVVESEEKFRNIFENTNAIFLIVEPESLKIVEANNGACRFYGYDKSEMLENIYLRQISTLPEIEIKKNINAAILQQSSFFNVQHRLKDGSVRDVEVYCGPVHIAGRVMIFCVVNDVTDKKASEEKIKLLAYALESINECITITDLEDNLTFVNNAFCEIYGYTREEVNGLKIQSVLNNNDPEIIEKNIIKNTMKGEWKGELINKKKNGEQFNISLSTSPIQDDKGEIIALLGVASDITERKQAEQELIRTKEKAEEMNKLKSNFLANMSHELRTPMIGMLGFSDILKEELTNPEQKLMAEEIYISGQRLLQTLNLILDLSRIESNKTELKFKEINIKEILTSSIKIFEPVARSKDLYLKIKSDYSNIYCQLDELLFDQIINNLVSNALKFTKAGGVNIDVELEQNEFDYFVVIKVSDTGIGISNEFQRLIFEEFRQVSEGFGRNYEGSGLGLTITKKTVELMHGTISVKSELGEGSVFSIRFPAFLKNVGKSSKPEISKKDSKNPGAAETNGLPKILLVENDVTSALITRIALKNICYIDVAENGEDAIELCGTKKYSAILMDIGLGLGINGIETGSVIRKIAGYENIPMVAFTAFAMQGDKENFLNQGMTHYISKPFQVEDLKNLMMEILPG